MSWEELLKIEPGTIVADWMDGDERCIIMRGPASLNAYIGVYDGHPMDRYDDERVDIYCHGGLTFAGFGQHPRLAEYYWYGWDYAHHRDYIFFYDEEFYKPVFDNLNNQHIDRGKKWLIEDVREEIFEVLPQFKSRSFFFKSLVEDLNRIYNFALDLVVIVVVWCVLIVLIS